MELTKQFINRVFVPKKLIYQSKLYKITKLINTNYIVKGYTIELLDGKIFDVIIKNIHPNADPTTGEFCLPDLMYEKELTEERKLAIENMICTFNVDSCYFTPWGEIEYSEQEERIGKKTQE